MSFAEVVEKSKKEKSKKNKLSFPLLSLKARQALTVAVKERDSIYDLLLLGIPEHTLSILDAKGGIIYIEELLSRTPAELMAIKGIGIVAIQQLLDKLSEYDKMDFLKSEYEIARETRECYGILMRDNVFTKTVNNV